MKVLISIKPEYASQIFTGVKKYEYRKTIFKRDNVESLLVYATNPVKKIIGEIFIEEILEDSPNNIWEATKEYSGVSYNFFMQYYANKSKGYAIKIKKAVLFERPIGLSDLERPIKAPQSFCYIE
ncbi:ASCH domain-containing protein [Paenibacillus alvei]|uniref:ASCH domain-containing protein n=1 Tax=Paenibacillus alvei TaxID=44250 RepID=UPI00228254E0|nr:ASCH domain-containing protein [Paenibacillus alvei]